MVRIQETKSQVGRRGLLCHSKQFDLYSGGRAGYGSNVKGTTMGSELETLVRTTVLTDLYKGLS
jgi:hypothetical protein